MTNRDETTATRLNAELLAMVRIAGTILQHTRLDDILAAITRELGQLIEFDCASVALVSADGKLLVIRFVQCPSGDPAAIEGRQVPLDERTLLGWVCTHRRAVLRPDATNDPRFVAAVADDPLGSDMVAPLIARGRVIGTLNVGRREANSLTDSDLEKLVNCANIASGAIEHALLLEEAKDLGERYRTLQRNASDIIMLVDRNTGRLVEVNRQCCDVLGFKEEDLLRKSYFDLFHTEDQFQARRDFVNIMSGKARSFVDRRLVGRDGSVIFVDVSANLVEVKSDTFIQVLVHDISQRKMLEQQIILQNKNLQDANQRLREVDEMKTEFLANISHELRTPLSVIIAYTEALRDGLVSDDDRPHFLDVIAENGQSLLRLINDLLDLSKLEVSGTMLSFTLSHIHDVIRVLWPKVSAAATQKGIDLSFKPGYEIPVVYIDNKRISQVLLSLAHNAVKFTDQGGKVEVSTRRSEEGVVVQVSDTGAGIPEDRVATIFDTFRQLDGSSTRRAGGLGIGLAIAKHIIELHGGKIWVESKAGVGSTFAFMIPVETDEVMRTPSDGAEPRTSTVPTSVAPMDV
ncbi:MAG TPA: ATP-binding protein [Candidatus Krumholzibacteria bacterium]|nr:ATP-binding protein [Candidatus Krumholzibacteria bacterium]